MKVTRKELNKIIAEEKQAQQLISLVEGNAGKVVGDAFGALMKDERFRALIIQLLSQAATDWIPNWLKNRQEQKRVETEKSTQPSQEVDEDGDGVPDEDEYAEMEDEVTQIIDRRMTANENKAIISNSRLRQIIREELYHTDKIKSIE